MTVIKMPCGGFFYDEYYFEFINGAFAPSGTYSEGDTFTMKTMCCGGFKYDADSFEVYEINNEKIFSYAGMDDEEIGEPVRVSCSLAFDSNFFEIVDGILTQREEQEEE